MSYKNEIFSDYCIGRIHSNIRGVIIISNKQGPIHITKAENVKNKLHELYNSNHSIWRYDPKTFSVETTLKDLDYLFSKMKNETKLIIEEDFPCAINRLQQILRQMIF